MSVGRQEKQMQPHYRRLPLKGLHNARDLGGYPTASGGATRWGVFIRSEAPSGLAPSDLDYLRTLGVTTSIDFRGDREIKRQPSDLNGPDWVQYLRSPAFNKQVGFATRDPGATPIASFVGWAETYVEMIEGCKDWVRQTLEYIAGSAGTVIYNCTTGKDRTGIISALLLGLAGVAEEDIIADYCVSEVYLEPVYERLRQVFMAQWPLEVIHLSNPFFKTVPDNMAVLLRHLREAYGGIDAYVRACGVPDAARAQLRERLTDC